jgi:hypothetical protein
MDLLDALHVAQLTFWTAASLAMWRFVFWMYV